MFDLTNCPSSEKVIVFTSHPLARAARQNLSDRFGPKLHFANLSTLRAGGMRAAASALRQLKADLKIVAVENRGASFYLKMLILCSCLMETRRGLVCYLDDGECISLSGGLVLQSAISIGLGALKNTFAFLRSTVSLGSGIAQSRLRRFDMQNTSCLYINGNLMYGVRAGGALGHIAGVANALVDKGYDVRYASTMPLEGLDPGVDYHRLKCNVTCPMPVDWALFSHSRDLIGQIKGAITDVSEGPPGFIYQRLSRSNYLATSLRRQIDVPLVVEYNGSEAWGSKNWGYGTFFSGLSRKAELKTLHAADLVVTVSSVLRDELVAEGIDPERVVYYPNCVDVTMFSPDRYSTEQRRELLNDMDVPRDSIVAGFIGTFGTWHGIPFLCDAIRQLIDTNGQWVRDKKLVFVICGDGQHSDAVRALAKDPNYAEFVRWPGLIAQDLAPLFLASTDILLSPHVSNPDGTPFFGSPTKIFEYMSSAKAIIAADLDQIGEVLIESIRPEDVGQDSLDLELNSHPAMLFTPGNREEFLNCLKILVDEPKLRQRLGQNAFRLANEKYKWADHVEAILAAMRRLS